MKNSKIIFEKEYSSESLGDVCEDVSWEIESNDAFPEPDEDGFFKGTLKVTMEFIPDDTE